jgi:hypothetical protein
VDFIKALELPGLAWGRQRWSTWNTGADAALQDFFATAYECVTNTVGERLVQLPSTRVRELIAHRKFGRNAIKVMTGIPNKGVFCLLIWATLPFRLQEMNQSPISSSTNPEKYFQKVLSSN